MTKQSLGFLLDERFERRGQFKVNARNDEFVRVGVSIHNDYVVGLTNGKKGKLLVDVASLSEALKNFSAVVITGGSSGIGKSFIELMGNVEPKLLFCNLSRRSPDILGGELKLRHIECDLSDAAQLSVAVESLVTLLNREAPEGRVLLINNSGFGTYGRFLESKIDQQVEIIDVNIRALVELTGRLLPLLVKRGGGVINIASTAAFQPTPLLATYGATKAFVLHWTLALAEELRGQNVRVLAVCPGPTETGFAARAGLGDRPISARLGQTPQAVVKEALSAWAAGHVLVVTGWGNRLLCRLSRWVSKPLAARIASSVIQRTTGRK